VATLEPRKQLDVLLAAVELLPDVHHQLVLVGEKGWFAEQLMQQIEHSVLKDRLVVTGYVPRQDLVALYSQAEVMVYPSLYEGFGLPPLEAMQCGCPVICSRSSSLPEVVGEAAVMVELGDSQQLAKALQELLSDEKMREQMRHKGLQQAQKFSWKRAAIETLDYFQQLVNHEPTSS